MMDPEPPARTYLKVSIRFNRIRCVEVRVFLQTLFASRHDVVGAVLSPFVVSSQQPHSQWVVRVGCCPPYRNGGVVSLDIDGFFLDRFCAAAFEHTQLVRVRKVGAVGVDANLPWNTSAELSQSTTSLFGDGVYVLQRLKLCCRSALVGVERACQRSVEAFGRERVAPAGNELAHELYGHFFTTELFRDAQTQQPACRRRCRAYREGGGRRREGVQSACAAYKEIVR